MKRKECNKRGRWMVSHIVKASITPLKALGLLSFILAENPAADTHILNKTQFLSQILYCLDKKDLLST